ncbi:MAG: AsmA-like C-terminal region-containing protein [Betaproteobacteria bacterium]
MPERKRWKHRLQAHRWWLVAVAGLVVAIGLCEWAEWPFLRGPLERGLARSTQREISLGQNFGVRLIGGLRFRSDRILIGPPPADHRPATPMAAEPLLQASDIRAVVPYATLFRLLRGDSGEDLRIGTLDIGAIDVRLARDSAGLANWRFGTAEKKSDAPLQIPEFGRLTVRQGHVAVDDAIAKLKLQAEVRTQEGDAAAPGAPSAGLEVAATGSYRDAPLTAALHSSGLVPLVTSEASLPPVPVNMDVRMGGTRFTLDGEARDLARFSDLKGKFRLSGPSLAAVGDIAGMTLPTTPSFAMHGDIAKAEAVWNVAVAELALGSSRLHGDFRFDPSPPVPQFTGNLRGKRLSLPDLGPAFGGKGSDRKRPSPAAASPRVLPQREFDLPSLGRMNADVDIKLDELHPGTGVIESLAPLEGKLSLHDRVLRVDNLLARTSGGEMRGHLGLDARQPTPRWEADLRWSGVRLERFIKPRNHTQAPTRPGGPPPGYVSGAMSGRAQLHGSGRSTATMLASLDGSANFWVANGQISHLLVEVAGIDIAQGLGMLVRGDEPLPMRCAVASMAIKDGRVTPEVGVIDTRDSTLIASGNISLAEERLALLLTVDPKDVSPMALRSPVHVEGTFSKPEIRVDKRPLGVRLGIAAALAAINPLASLLALVDLGEPEKAVCQQALQRVGAAAKTSAPTKRK